MRRFAPTCVLCVLWLAPLAPWAEEHEVTLFRPATGGFALDDGKLADAVRTYTRGVAWNGAPGGLARLTVWYEGHQSRGGEVTVTLYVLPPGQEDRGPAVVEVRGRRDGNLYRALALKVRSVLVGDPTIERVAAAPARLVPSKLSVETPTPPTVQAAPAPTSPTPVAAPASPAVAIAAPTTSAPPTGESPSPTSAGATATLTVRPPSPPSAAPTIAPDGASNGAPTAASAATSTAPAARAPVPVASVAQGAARPSVRGGVEATFRSALSDGSQLARYGGAFALYVDVAPRFEVVLGTALDSQIGPSDAPGTAHATLVPVHAGLRVRLGRAWFEAALGLRGGAAFVSTTAASEEGRRATDGRVLPMVGADAALRARLHRIVALEALLSLDALLDRVRYTVEGSAALDTGRVLGGLGLGLAVTFP